MVVSGRGQSVVQRQWKLEVRVLCSDTVAEVRVLCSDTVVHQDSETVVQKKSHVMLFNIHSADPVETVIPKSVRSILESHFSDPPSSRVDLV